VSLSVSLSWISRKIRTTLKGATYFEAEEIVLGQLTTKWPWHPHRKQIGGGPDGRRQSFGADPRGSPPGDELAAITTDDVLVIHRLKYMRDLILRITTTWATDNVSRARQPRHALWSQREKTRGESGGPNQKNLKESKGVVKRLLWLPELKNPP